MEQKNSRTRFAKGSETMRAIRALLVVQIALFAYAALTHLGIISTNHRHPPAGTAESVIGAVLLIGLLGSWMAPSLIRSVAVLVQAFALLGTILGIVTIIIGIGPRSMLDAALHTSMIITLVVGLVISLRLHPTNT
jgi:hypothetical protein